MGRFVELTAVVIIVAYIAANGSDFATVITSLGNAYSKAVKSLLSGAAK